jgi:hypothetical protein
MYMYANRHSEARAKRRELLLAHKAEVQEKLAVRAANKGVYAKEVRMVNVMQV